MAIKEVDIDGIGRVRLQRRRGTRHLRISINAQGDVRVSLPAWAPYKLGLEFAQRKKDWITKNRSVPVMLADHQIIGKSHRLAFISSTSAKRPSCRLQGNIIRVTYPVSWHLEHPEVQKAAYRGIVKALQTEAVTILPSRVETIAKQYGFTYSTLAIKHLRSKWGSCNQRREITLNSFLMTLPWELIDYVILHELVHTKIMRHGEPFWQEMAVHNPKLPFLRKQIRQQRPGYSSLLT